MAANNSPFIPNDPVNVAIRPLNKGMILNLPTTALPSGAGVRADNFIVHTEGLYRRPGYEAFAANDQAETLDIPLYDIATGWNSSGVQAAVVIGSKYVNDITIYGGLSPVVWSYSVGAVKISGVYVSSRSASTNWLTTTNELQAGDLFQISDGSHIVEISSITTSNQLVLLSAPATSYSSVAYNIRRTFNPTTSYLVDWTAADYKIIFADGSRFLYYYKDSAFGDYASGVTDYKPKCVVFFADRIWIGNIIESGAHYRQRIRWSSATDRTSFAAADYLDLPYSAGGIRRLVPLGDMLIAYLDDAVWYGRATNYTDLPYAFNRLETGGRGLVGTKAICSWLNSHYWVSQDDVFVTNVNGTVEAIGSPVVKETIRKCDNLSYVYVVPDPQNDSICFGFPETSTEIAKIWRYEYKAKAWSYDSVQATMLANPTIDLSYSWDDMVTYLGASDTWTDGGALIATWDDARAGATLRRLYYSYDGRLRKLSDTGSSDPGGAAINAVFDSADYDFGEPGLDKTVLSLSARIERAEGTTDAIDLTVYGSGNRGTTWKSLGTIALAAAKDEGIVTFRMTGSIFRFRLACSTECGPFTITEVTLRVRGRGKEVRIV